MAKRFGGKYSPDGSQTTHASGTPGSGTSASRQVSGQNDGARVHPVGARANVLFVPAIPLVAITIGQGAVSMALGLAGAAILTLAAWLLRGGLEAQAEYEARRVARRPALPRKLIASVLTGLGVGCATLAHDGPILAAAIYAIAAAGLHLAAFGPDPLKDKGMEGIDTFQQDRVARVVDEAEAHLAAMQDALKRAGDRTAQARLERFAASVRKMARTVEEDPRDLAAARKYLGVYLLGARDAAVKFADIFSRTRDGAAQQKYLALLDDLDENFSAKTAKLMADSQVDLDIEIDVLRERLAREGVRLDATSSQQDFN